MVPNPQGSASSSGGGGGLGEDVKLDVTDEKKELLEYSVPYGVVQVLNLKTGVVHLSSGAGVACNAWKAGSSTVPHKNSEWAKSSSRWSNQKNPYAFCVGCHCQRSLTKLGGKVVVAGSVLSDEGSSSSESGSESSGSSSSSS